MAKAKRASARRKSVSSAARRKASDPHPQPLPTRGRGEVSAASAASSKPKPAYASLRRGKHKGGPVAGTPSPMRTRLSGELQAYARRLFTETDQPGTEIAVDCGVDESVIRRMAKREGWVRFVAPPRDLPPVAKLLAEVEELEVSLTKAPSIPTVTPTPNPSPQGGGEKEESAAASSSAASVANVDEQDSEQRIETLTQAVMGYVREFDALRKNGKLLAKQHLATARAISILTEAFNRLQRLRAALPGSIDHDSYADAPADLDAFRDELARRIDAFIASRTDAGTGGEDDAARTDVAP